MTERESFRNNLREKPLLLDGAMGTVLQARGGEQDKCLDALNHRDPALVAEVHRTYIAAGADIIETNTFGANRLRLAEFDLADQVASLNRDAVEIARRVINSSFKPVMLAGSVGPSGLRLAPLGRMTLQEADAVFTEQLSALIGAGVDLLIIETMPDLAEVKVVVEAARRISAEIPILTMMTFAQDDRTLLGVSSAEIAQRLSKLDIDAIGINCSSGPAQIHRLINTMHTVVPEMLLAAMPNAGYPARDTSGRVAYPATPAYFAEYVHAYVDAGVNIIGGCCGTTDAHIVAMRTALDKPKPSTITLPPVELIGDKKKETVASDPPTQLKQSLSRGDFVVTVEMRPPKGITVQKMLASARMLVQSGVGFLDIADIPLARMRMSAWAAAFLVQQQAEVETILHFPTRGRNLLRVQADLLAAHALGIRNLFVTMGDPARIGDYPDAFDSHDIVSTGLVKLIKEQMNAGLDKSGAALDQPTNFTVGTAASLTPRNMLKEAKLLNKKIRFGADFALTQPCFDVQQAHDYISFYRAEFGDIALPLIVGIQPLYNRRNADYLHNEVPGITIPAHFRERMREATDPQATGVAIALEIARDVRELVQGVYVVPAFGRYDLAAQIVESL